MVKSKNMDYLTQTVLPKYTTLEKLSSLRRSEDLSDTFKFAILFIGKSTLEMWLLYKWMISSDRNLPKTIGDLLTMNTVEDDRNILNKQHLESLPKISDSSFARQVWSSHLEDEGRDCNRTQEYQLVQQAILPAYRYFIKQTRKSSIHLVRTHILYTMVVYIYLDSSNTFRV